MAYVPARMYVSNGFTPAAWMRTTACPGPAFGVGNSSSFMTSGAPNSCTTMAFISLFSLAREISCGLGSKGEFWRLTADNVNERRLK